MKFLITILYFSFLFQQKEAKEYIFLNNEYDPPYREATSWYVTNKNNSRYIEIKVKLYNYAPTPATYNEIKTFVIEPNKKRYISPSTPARYPTYCSFISARFYP